MSNRKKLFIMKRHVVKEERECVKEDCSCFSVLYEETSRAEGELQKPFQKPSVFQTKDVCHCPLQLVGGQRHQAYVVVLYKHLITQKVLTEI